MLKAITLALAALAANAAMAQGAAPNCSTDALRSFGDTAAMEVSYTGSPRLPCSVEIGSSTSRGVINYGNEDDVTPALDGDTGPRTLSVYTSGCRRCLDDWLAPDANVASRTNFFALTSGDRRQVVLALEATRGGRFISVYVLNLDTLEEQLSGRFSLEISPRENNMLSAAFEHRNGKLESLSIRQNSSTSTLDFDRLFPSLPITPVSWAYGNLQGGFGENSIATDGLVPVQIYLNNGARPFED